MRRVSDFDILEYLDSEEAIAAYLNAALEEGDASMLGVALGDIARAKGMTRLPKRRA